MPKVVYRATDRVRPRWRFLAIAVNRGTAPVVLETSAVTLNTACGPIRQTQSGDGIQGILQGARRVPAGGVVVLSIEDRAALKAVPRSVRIQLSFLSERGKKMSVGRTVPLVRRPTLWLSSPFAAEWFTVNDRSVLHGVAGSFAYDLGARGDLAVLKHRQKKGLSLEEHASFGQPLLSPVDGVVVSCRDDQADIAPTPGRTPYPGGPPKDGREQYFGNYIAISTSRQECILMVHLRKSSLRVRVGDRVHAGQQVAQVGNSGNTSGPHLHIEVSDGVPDLSKAATLDMLQSGVPFGFRDVGLLRKGARRPAGKIVPRRWDVLRTVSGKSRKCTST